MNPQKKMLEIVIKFLFVLDVTADNTHGTVKVNCTLNKVDLGMFYPNDRKHRFLVALIPIKLNEKK